MWRILTIISGIVLIASAWLGLLNKSKLADETADCEKNQLRLDKVNEMIGKEEALIAEAKKVREENEAFNKKASADLISLNEKNGQLSSEISASRDKIKEYNDKIAEITQKMSGMPDMDALAENIATMEKEKARISQDVADKEARLAASEARATHLEAQIQRLEKREDDIRNRVSPADLRAQIASVHNSLGFVIINAGVNKEIIPQSKLAVMRGNSKVAELMVSTVEKNRAAADIVPGSVASGQMLSPGDQIISIRPVPVAKPAAPVARKPGAEEDQKPAEDAAAEDDVFGESSTTEDGAADASAETPAEDDASSGETSETETPAEEAAPTDSEF